MRHRSSQPLDRAVRDALGVSWGKARELIARGKVLVDGEPVLDETARVSEGQEVSIASKGARRPAPSVDVVFVDAQVVVVAKPAGVSTVPYDERETDTLDARVRAWLSRSPHARGRGAGRPPLGIVHRLDKETSGLVVFTRTWAAKKALALQFRQHTVLRKYVAIANGRVQAGTFRTYLLEDRGDGLRGSARGPRPPPGAREAVTHVAVVEELHGATVVACRLETGRTHQIRIHLSEAGHPLVGERVYVRGAHDLVESAPRLMLHAAELGFVHPVSGETVRWEQPLPADMVAMIERLRRA